MDHHHDFGYGNDNINEIRRTNWAQYLLNNKLLKNYFWIYDFHSTTTSLK